MTKDSTRNIGAKGEDIVAEYLMQKGWRILERNFYTRIGEVDIIAVDYGALVPNLVFIEVKFRTSNKFGDGIEQFTRQKRLRVKKTSLHFLKRQTVAHNFGKIRFDFITVTQTSDGKFHMKHFKNI